MACEMQVHKTRLEDVQLINLISEVHYVLKKTHVGASGVILMLMKQLTKYKNDSVSFIVSTMYRDSVRPVKYVLQARAHKSEAWKNETV